MSGPQCCENPPALNPASGQGHVEELGGLKSYVSGSSASNLAIVLVCDVFGYEAPNLRKLADKVAATGFYVVVPDFLGGDPYVPENAERPIMEWIKDHGTDKGYEDAKRIIEAVKGKGASAIGAAGFCWGAKVVVQLAKTGAIDAAVLLHPSLVSVDDIQGVKAPIAILGAETDHRSPPELLKQFEEILAATPEVDARVKIFPKVSHGWTVRYDVADEEAVKRAEEAHSDMLEWFVKFVK
ncbi:endo-1,3;1,4-beta-D-glucanase-like [Rhodamnia argentea]|uniref:Endo-1,31,4-beta-D-glucanase-like n=1 Tax=Rhodamnia argentea TaxID=178133 RepID=A0ABM3GZB3_9MYRT|nr:endo-1,3;1,4-beta-D-glucanase-like [Rhodamnia argentea]XP_048129682.1 endo-1,3;1,4-beta-D-glucanase-like [Rhodamnia argentea]